MFNDVLVYVLKFYSFIIVFLVLVLFISISLSYKFKKFSLDIPNIKWYTIFLNLKNTSIIALSTIIIHYAFIIWYLADLPSYNLIYLLLLIILAVIFNICLKRYLHLFLDVANSIVEYGVLILLSLLTSYMNDVRLVWYVLLIVILLMLFMLIYATYFFLKNLKDVIVKD